MLYLESHRESQHWAVEIQRGCSKAVLERTKVSEDVY